ncbi:MAG: T9SS type A sorting domain-containing protein [Fibrobacterota bacterium]
MIKVLSIEMWWTHLSTRCTNVPVIIYDSLTALDTMTINQTANGGLWNMLMPGASFSTHQIRIEIRHPGVASRNICADAVRIIGNPTTISGGTVAAEAALSDINLPFSLMACPNPFNPTLSVTYSIPVESPVELAVFNVQGRKVMDLSHNAAMMPGRYTTTWNGTEENGKRASSGLYIVQLRMGKRIKIFKAMMLK